MRADQRFRHSPFEQDNPPRREFLKSRIFGNFSRSLQTDSLPKGRGMLQEKIGRKSDSLARRLVVVFGGLLLEFVLDVAPDCVAGFGGLEEALGGFGDGFEVADEG